MTITIAPADEACQALVTLLNASSGFVLDIAAHYSRMEIDRLEEINELRVDVVAISENQLHERLDFGDTTSLLIDVVIRKKVIDKEIEVPDLSLLCRQIAAVLNNWNSPDRRVQVWECDPEEKERPDKKLLNDASLFLSTIHLRIEVQP